MTSERLEEVFKGDSADMCAGKFPLVSMGGRADTSRFKYSWKAECFDLLQSKQLLLIPCPIFVIAKCRNLFGQRNNEVPIHRSFLCPTKGLLVKINVIKSIYLNWNYWREVLIKVLIVLSLFCLYSNYIWPAVPAFQLQYGMFLKKILFEVKIYKTYIRHIE